MSNIINGKSKEEVEEFLKEKKMKYKIKFNNSILVNIENFDDFELLDIKDSASMLISLSTPKNSSLGPRRMEILEKTWIDNFNKNKGNYFVLIVFEKLDTSFNSLYIVKKDWTNETYNRATCQDENIPFYDGVDLDYYIFDKKNKTKYLKIYIMNFLALFSPLCLMLFFVYVMVFSTQLITAAILPILILCTLPSLLHILLVKKCIDENEIIPIKINDIKEKKTKVNKYINIMFGNIVFSFFGTIFFLLSTTYFYNSFIIKQDVEKIQNNEIVSGWSYETVKNGTVVKKELYRNYGIPGLKCVGVKNYRKTPTTFDCFVTVDDK